MKHIKHLWATAPLTLLLLIILIVTPLFAAGYIMQITVVESNGTSYTNLPIIASVNNTYLAANNYMTSNGLDTRVIGAGNVTLPHMLADNKTLFVSNVVASSTSEVEFKSGQSALTAFPIIVGDTGYITRVDASKLEPGDNFALTISLYLKDSGTYMVKEDALEFYYNASTEVLYAIAGDSETPDITLEATNIEPGLHVVILSANSEYEELEDYTSMVGNGTPSSSTLIDGTIISRLFDYRTDTGVVFERLDIVSPAWVKYDFGEGNAYAINKVEITNIFHPVDVIARDPIDFTISGSNNDSDYDTLYSVTDFTWTYAPQYQAVTFDNTNNYRYIKLNITRYTSSPGYCELSKLDFLTNVSLESPALNLYVDDILADSAALTTPIPDNNNPWLIYPNPYFNYVKLETGN